MIFEEDTFSDGVVHTRIWANCKETMDNEELEKDDHRTGWHTGDDRELRCIIEWNIRTAQPEGFNTWPEGVVVPE